LTTIAPAPQEILVDPRQLPDVTVVIAAATATSTLTVCLESLLAQTIPADRLEILLIGTAPGRLGRAVNRRVRRYPDRLHAIRDTGRSAAAARNRGIDEARGRYLMFLDGSRRLAPGALATMVETADREESDIVLAGAPRGVASVFSGAAYWSLSADKIYRAELLRRRNLRFPSGTAGGDVEEFTASAYVGADLISAVEDPATITPIDARGDAPVPASERIASAARMMAYVEANVPDGAQRDHLMRRHFEVDLGAATGLALMSEPADQRAGILESARRLLSRHLTPEIRAALPALMTVRFALIERGHDAAALTLAARKPDAKAPKKVIEDGRVYASYPFFRDLALGVPDDAFDITDELTVTQELENLSWSGAACTLTGYAFFEELSTRKRDTRILLRERRSGAEQRFIVTSVQRLDKVNRLGKARSMCGYRCRVNLRQTGDGYPIQPGLWDVYASVSFEGVTREVRLGHQRSAKVDTTARRSIVISEASIADGHELIVMPYFTDHDNLTFEVSSRLPLPL
jgi:hypothetical protein